MAPGWAGGIGAYVIRRHPGARGSRWIGSDAAALHLGGKPLVAIWGIGFKDRPEYSVDECRELISSLEADGCAVLCGVPTGWRTLDRDATPSVALHEIVAMFDEVDEATAIFKCIDPPTPELAKRFVGVDGLPTDHYLRLTGEIGRMLRDEKP